MKSCKANATLFEGKAMTLLNVKMYPARGMGHVEKFGSCAGKRMAGWLSWWPCGE